MSDDTIPVGGILTYYCNPETLGSIPYWLFAVKMREGMEKRYPDKLCLVTLSERAIMISENELLQPLAEQIFSQCLLEIVQ